MTAPAYRPQPHHRAELAGWVPPAAVIPLRPAVAVQRRSLFRGHGRTVVAVAALTVWVAVMVLCLLQRWSVVPPMVVGAIGAFVWGVLGDVYHHRQHS